jgi:hypothetical protein
VRGKDLGFLSQPGVLRLTINVIPGSETTGGHILNARFGGGSRAAD